MTIDFKKQNCNECFKQIEKQDNSILIEWNKTTNGTCNYCEVADVEVYKLSISHLMFYNEEGTILTTCKQCWKLIHSSIKEINCQRQFHITQKKN